MKKVLSIFFLVFAGLGLGNANAAAPAKPVPGVINAQQLEKIKVGQTKNEVIAQIGKPKNQTKWRDGSTSLVYKLEGHGISGNTAVYIDIDTKTEKVLRYVVQDQNSGDGDSGGDSGGGNDSAGQN